MVDIQFKHKFNAGKYFKIIEIPKFSLKDILKKYKKKLLLGFDPQLFTSSLIKINFNNILIIPIKKIY